MGSPSVPGRSLGRVHSFAFGLGDSMNLSDLGRLGVLLRAIRRRLRLAWALDTVQLLAPVVAVTALVLVGLSWITPWSVPGERVALVIAIAAVVLVVVFALALRLPDRIVARAADRGLRTKDAFSTALEIPADIVPFGDKIRERAVRLASGSRARDAVTLPWRRRPVVLAAALTPIVLALALTTSPQDDRRAEDERNRAAIDDAIDEIDDASEEISERPEATEALEQLDELTGELAQTNDPAEAEELLREAAAELDRGRDPEALAERAATQGLESSVASEPLPGSDSSTGASEQFEQLAGELDAMTPEEMAAAAERLDDLAATQEAGDPQAAAALAEAAEAMRSGNATAAAAALGEAAAAHASASASASATAALGEASAVAGQAADGLSGGGDPNCRPETAPGSSVPEELEDLPVCNTSGSGDGNGDGNGSGSASGSGSGSGSGGGGAGGGGGGGSGGGSGGSGSGTIGGVNSDGSGASGQGGQGQAADSQSTNGQSSDQAPDLDTVFDPAHGSGGDQLTVGGGAGAGDGGTIGTNDGPTNDGASRVNIAESVTDYAQEATSALDGAIVAPSDRELVTDYFDELQQRE